MRHILLCAAALAVALQIQAQTIMGTWRTHFTYNSVTQIAQSPTKVYAMSNGALFSVDKRDDNIEIYSSISGLSGNTITKIAYDNALDKLLITYSDGKIDLLHDDNVETIVDLYNKVLNGEKNINDVCFHDGRAYLSASFGVLVVNMKRGEIAETYYIGDNASDVNVVSTGITSESIYAASESDIYQCAVNSKNLMNFENWSTMSGLPGSGKISKLLAYNNHLYMVRNKKLYQLDGTTWKALLTSESVVNLSTDQSSLFVMLNKNYFYNSADGVTFDKITTGTLTSSDVVLDALAEYYWTASGAVGLGRYHIADAAINAFMPDGPMVSSPVKLRFGGDRLFMVQGDRWASSSGKNGNVMIYDNGSWINLAMADINSMTKRPVTFGSQVSNARDFMDIAPDPENNHHYFVSSYQNGVYEFYDDTVYAHYDSSDPYSGLNNLLNNNLSYTRCDAIAYDRDGRLWVANHSTNALHMMDRDRNWHSFRFGGSDYSVLNTITFPSADRNLIWVTVSRASELLFFNHNGTFDDQTDDAFLEVHTFRDQDNEEIAPTFYLCATEDKNAEIWCGTTEGIFVLQNAQNCLSGNYRCRRIKIPRDDGTGLADYLLDGVRVNDIQVDGANRKWIATEGNGVYLVSENGIETIQRFTTSNSPLPSDVVKSIAIHPQTGEVFFGTASGLVSYQSDAAESSGSYSTIYAYPNPVRENYNGIITLRGMTNGSLVRITDMSGNVVCDTRSNGSLAVWDGKDKQGRRVAAGIYLVICSNEDGTETGRSRLLFIR
ncbi:MAG: T9SS type A sorting domain-containing protein [Paludibacteraceae bacterium]|nr:T9SS type A sorting domain-containing protein [Paludibacteraceae bacterium]